MFNPHCAQLPVADGTWKGQAGGAALRSAASESVAQGGPGGILGVSLVTTASVILVQASEGL